MGGSLAEFSLGGFLLLVVFLGPKSIVFMRVNLPSIFVNSFQILGLLAPWVWLWVFLGGLGFGLGAGVGLVGLSLDILGVLVLGVSWGVSSAAFLFLWGVWGQVSFGRFVGSWVGLVWAVVGFQVPWLGLEAGDTVPRLKVVVRVGSGLVLHGTLAYLATALILASVCVMLSGLMPCACWWLVSPPVGSSLLVGWAVSVTRPWSSTSWQSLWSWLSWAVWSIVAGLGGQVGTVIALVESPSMQVGRLVGWLGGLSSLSWVGFGSWVGLVGRGACSSRLGPGPGWGGTWHGPGPVLGVGGALPGVNNDIRVGG